VRRVVKVVLVRVMFRAMMAPAPVTIRGAHLSSGGRKGSWVGEIINQLIMAPPMIAPLVRNIIGVVVFLSSSEVSWGGSLMFGVVSAVTVSRIE